MFDVFKIFRIVGTFPIKFRYKIPFPSKNWHIYSYIFASIVFCIANYRFLYFLNWPVDTESSYFFYLFMVKYEPAFLLTHLLIIYHTVPNKQNIKRAIKLFAKVLEIQPKRNSCYKSEIKIIIWTLACCVILFLLAIIFWFETPNGTIRDLFDYLGCGMSLSLITLQILHFSVYFEMVIAAIDEIEYSSKEKIQGQSPIENLHKIHYLRGLIKKFERFYHSNIIAIELNFMVYCTMGYRGIYDLAFQNYQSLFMGIASNIYTLYNLPLIYYLMHLSDLIEEKVRIF